MVEWENTDSITDGRMGKYPLQMVEWENTDSITDGRMGKYGLRAGRLAKKLLLLFLRWVKCYKLLNKKKLPNLSL